MEAPSKITTLTTSVKSFTGGASASTPVSSYTTKTMRHIRHSHTPLKLEMLSDPHKIDRSRLTNVCHGSFMGSETRKHTSTFLRQLYDSMETVHQQTVI